MQYRIFGTNSELSGGGGGGGAVVVDAGVVVVCLDVVEELVVGEGVVEVLYDAVVSTNTKGVELEFVALLAFLERFVLLVGTGVVHNGVVVVVHGTGGSMQESEFTPQPLFFVPHVLLQ